MVRVEAGGIPGCADRSSAPESMWGAGSPMELSMKSDQALILSFPYRIYGEPFLPVLEGVAPDGNHRIRVHPPFRSAKSGSPVSPEVPFENWTSFAWHPDLHSSRRLRPPSNLSVSSLGSRAYDSIRLDCWGPDGQVVGLAFFRLLIEWIRHVTSQAWVGRVETQADSPIKGSFSIDLEGRAVDTPFAHGRNVGRRGTPQPLDADLWRRAFHLAQAGTLPPAHWSLLFDAENAVARDQIGEAVLALALALEVGRDITVSRIAPNLVIQTVTGLRLRAPFAGTDVLAHLDTGFKRIVGTSLADSNALAWAGVRSIYIARGNVAHGRDAVVTEGSLTRPASSLDVLSWLPSAKAVLQWLDALSSP